MTTTVRDSQWQAMVNRVLGYTGLFLIGAMAWTCDRLGVAAAAPRSTIGPAVRGAQP